MAFKGTSIYQDSRFKSKEHIDASSIKLPEIFKANIDMSKIEIEVIKHWIDNKLSSILQVEDDSLAEYFYNILLEDYKQPLKLYSMMNQFLEKATIPFLTKLWQILDSCQNSEFGISHLIIQTEFEKLNRNLLEIDDKINICNNIIKLHKEKIIINKESKFLKENPIDKELINIKDCNNNEESSNRRNHHLNTKDNKIRDNRKSRDEDFYYYSKYNKDTSNDRDDRYYKYSDYKTNKDRSYAERKYRYSRDRYNSSKEKDRVRDRDTKYYNNKYSKYDREQRDHYKNYRDYSRGRRRSSCSHSRSSSNSYSMTSRYSRSRYSSPVTLSSRSRSRRRSNSYHKNSRSRLETVKQTIKKINK